MRGSIRVILLSALICGAWLPGASDAQARERWWEPVGRWAGEMSWTISHSYSEPDPAQETGVISLTAQLTIPPLSAPAVDEDAPRPARLSIHGFHKRNYLKTCPGPETQLVEETMRLDYEGPWRAFFGIGRRFEGDPRRFISIGLAGGMNGGLVDWDSGEVAVPNIATGNACGQVWTPDNDAYPLPWPFTFGPTEYEWVEPDCDHETYLPIAHQICMHVTRTGRLEQRWTEECAEGGRGLYIGRQGCLMSVSMRFAKLGHNDRDGDRLPDRWERRYKLSTRRDSRSGDPDRDRLSNALEYLHRTSPRRRDTDGDGFRDGAEVLRYGTNPRKPSRRAGNRPTTRDRRR
jgi:thrombospondin type 3 repeat protein